MKELIFAINNLEPRLPNYKLDPKWGPPPGILYWIAPTNVIVHFQDVEVDLFLLMDYVLTFNLSVSKYKSLHANIPISKVDFLIPF